MKYYLHDTSSSDDEKITELYMEYGYEGLGLWWTFLEKIGKQEKPIKTTVLKSQLKVGKRLNKCWVFMEEIGLISSNNGESFNNELLNFSEKYQIKKEKTRKKVAEWRDNQADKKSVTSYVPVSNPPKVKESKVNKTTINWRDDFIIYLNQCKDAYKELNGNDDFIKVQEEFYPNVNIRLSIKKGFVNFWGTKAGWKKKKASKYKTIDWKSTIINSIGMNKVYYTKQELADR